MEEMGLAAQGAGQGMGITVEQVVEMLMAGTTPEELMAQGVAPEMIEKAIAILEEQATLGQAQMPGKQDGMGPVGMGQGQGGLAQRAVV